MISDGHDGIKALVTRRIGAMLLAQNDDWPFRASDT
ncbi:hypothetical protein HNR56_003698 [Roseospira marina]|nr:hypothetical protein [Roseospira marina]